MSKTLKEELRMEEKFRELIPEVLVIGAGIAGMQAALDIADKGFKVHLVEKDPSIGGHMAQLDKTFPTLDCSACIITPKMVDTANHPNIHLLTYTEVVHIDGKAGDFKVILRKKPRYVDMAKCTACADCVAQCPVSLPNEFDMGLAKRKAIYVPFPQAVPLKYTIDRRRTPPCTGTCPAHIHAQGYVALISAGKYAEALSLIRENLPLPGILGRICPHPCETECNRKGLDKPVAICELKRFAADRVKTEIPVQKEETKEERVAIVGSGPAGLTAAAFLAQKGYSVTIFEALPVTGGMLYAGIPSYRLPRDILEEEVYAIQSLGVEMKTNSPIGPSLTFNDLLGRGYRAIFIAVGAHQDQKLGIPGEENPCVLPGVVFLRKVNLGDKVKVGERVAVIGGGNVAIDAARTALRLGAEEVTIIYRRSRDEMPAYEEDVEEAEEEGIRFQYLAAPIEIVSKNKESISLRCIKMELGDPDRSGRRRPVPIQGSDFWVELNTLISAIGQVPDLSFMEGMGIETTPRGTIQVDPITLETSQKGIFAGGDAVTGPGIAIDAVAAGKEAAISIDRYLKGQDLYEGRSKPKLENARFEDIYIDQPVAPREKVEMLPLQKRRKTFSEVKKGFSEEQAKREALRCLNCGGCSDCGECAKYCQPKAVVYGMKEEMLEFHVGAIIVATGFDPFDPKRKPEFGYGHYPNVLHGLELERLCSASGPTKGEILIQGKKPKEVIFIHCVGSRDKTVGNEYCSRVCCMYTAKQAHLLRDKIPDARLTVLYMDVRAFGKGFEEFYERVQKEEVIYRRGNPSEIYRRNGKLVVRGEDTLLGEPFELEADLVVLAGGLVPRKEDDVLKEMLRLEKSSDQFYAEAPGLDPIVTGVEGVFLAGCCQGPKDIPDTVAQASGAASLACVILAHGRKASSEL
jgi:heterodisulfide reductase subunit A